MKIASKIPVSVLIAILVTATLADTALAGIDHSVAMRSGPRAAGCHAHRDLPLPDPPARHSPTPAKYQCCLTGHDAAMVQATHGRHQPVLWTRATAKSATEILSVSSGKVDCLVISAWHSPGLSPLRI
jgi:hypothetical protein